jgi:hypothetical protein
MKRGLLMIGALLLGPVLATAGSAKFIGTWKNPNAGLIDVSAQKVATFVMNPDEGIRMGREETLAAEMRQRGTNAVAGYTVLPGELAKDQEKAKAFLQKAGITGAVIIRGIGQREETYYVPDMWYTGPYYPTFWGYWNYGWAAVYSPGYVESDTIVSFDVLVYSIEQNTLLWAGRCEITNPKDVRKVAKDLADEAGKQMRKAGLLKK